MKYPVTITMYDPDRSIQSCTLMLNSGGFELMFATEKIAECAKKELKRKPTSTRLAIETDSLDDLFEEGDGIMLYEPDKK